MSSTLTCNVKALSVASSSSQLAQLHLRWAGCHPVPRSHRFRSRSPPGSRLFLYNIVLLYFIFTGKVNQKKKIGLKIQEQRSERCVSLVAFTKTPPPPYRALCSASSSSEDFFIFYFIKWLLSLLLLGKVFGQLKAIFHVMFALPLCASLSRLLICISSVWHFIVAVRGQTKGHTKRYSPRYRYRYKCICNCVQARCLRRGGVLFMICQDFNPRKCVLNCSAYDKN